VRTIYKKTHFLDLKSYLRVLLLTSYLFYTVYYSYIFPSSYKLSSRFLITHVLFSQIFLSRDCCDDEINVMVEDSKFRESHILKIPSQRAKKGGMPRPLLVVYYPYFWLSSPVPDLFPDPYSRQII
jgi:hypothetical protein